MSWDFYTNKKVVARKEYRCDWQEHLEMCNIIYRDRELKKWFVNKSECADLSMSDEDIETLTQYCDTEFKIRVGELHGTTSGKFDGNMCTLRAKIEITDLMYKYDLVYED